MAPLIKSNPTDKRAQGIADLAQRALQQLQNRLPISTNTAVELDAACTQPFPKFGASASKDCSLENVGIGLWNIATNLARDTPAEDAVQRQFSPERFVACLRVFAFLLIDTAHRSNARGNKHTPRQTWIFKISLKASRLCLDKHAMDYASVVLERCSEYASSIEDALPAIRLSDADDMLEDGVRSKLVAEYYMIRMAHAWKMDRFDMAEHFFRKISKDTLAQVEDSAQSCAELCLKAGRDLLSKGQSDGAMKWLDRANEVLNACNELLLSGNGEDLRLAIAACIVEALCKQQTPGSCQRACDLLSSLEHEHGLGSRTALLVMHLKLALRALPPHVEELASILNRMVQNTILTDSTFVTFMHAVHKVHKVDSNIATKAVHHLVCARLIPDLETAMEPNQVKDWLEKSVVTFTMLSTSGTAKAGDPALSADLLDLVNQIAQATTGPLSAKATHALQTLIWKASNASGGRETGRWLALLKHPLFHGAGVINKARIGRKAMLVALDRNDSVAARQAFFEMPELARNENQSRYLAFRVAVQSDDHALALESLDMLLKHCDQDSKFLFACVLEAQQSSSRVVAIAAFQAMLERTPAGVHLPALLRCTARLLFPELNLSSQDLARRSNELIRVFEVAAANTRQLRQGSEEHWRAEIQWWSKNAYNIALDFCAEMHPEQLIRLLRACLKFLDCYPDDGSLMHHDDRLHRRQICHFLITSALVILGRTAEERHSMMQNYAEARREIVTFMQLQKEVPSDINSTDMDRARALEMLKFDLECAFKLEQWDQLKDVLSACLDFEAPDRWDTLADLVIMIHTETRHLNIDSSAVAQIPDLLQKIIGKTWRIDRDVLKLARWLRVSFSMELSDGDGDLSLRLLEQATKMAKRGAEGSDPERYPESELQWLAITAWNRAVDSFVAGEAQKVQQWADGALGLATYADDGGVLHAHLTSMRDMLKSDVKP